MIDRFLDLDLIVARLRAQVPADLVRHIGRIDLPGDAKLARAAGYPGLRVVGLRTAVTHPNGVPGVWRLERFGVICDLRDVSGAKTWGRNTLVAMRSAVDLALTQDAWSPGDVWSPVAYAGGRLLGVDDGVYSHIDEYETEHSAGNDCPYGA